MTITEVSLKKVFEDWGNSRVGLLDDPNLALHWQVSSSGINSDRALYGKFMYVRARMSSVIPRVLLSKWKHEVHFYYGPGGYKVHWFKNGRTKASRFTHREYQSPDILTETEMLSRVLGQIEEELFTPMQRLGRRLATT